MHRLDDAGALEGIAAGEHFIGHDTDGEQVRARISRFAPHLLGRHIAGSAENQSVHRLVPRPSFAANRRQELGQSEVENFDIAVGQQEHVLRLHVAMHDSARVRRCQTTRDAERHVDRLAHRQRSGLETLAQALSFETLGDEHGKAGVFADVVDREQVRMVE